MTSAIYRFTTAAQLYDLPSTEHLEYLPLKNDEGQWRLVAINEADYDEQEKLYKQASVNGSVSQYKFSFMYKWQERV